MILAHASKAAPTVLQRGWQIPSPSIHPSQIYIIFFICSWYNINFCVLCYRIEIIPNLEFRKNYTNVKLFVQNQRIRIHNKYWRNCQLKDPVLNPYDKDSFKLWKFIFRQPNIIFYFNFHCLPFLFPFHFFKE